MTSNKGNYKEESGNKTSMTRRQFLLGTAGLALSACTINNAKFDGESKNIEIPFCGMNLQEFPESYGSDASKQAVHRLRDISCNYIMLILNLSQNSIYSAKVTPVKNIQNILGFTKHIKSMGLQVGWLPFLNILDGTWRGKIEPSSIDEWIKSYKEAMHAIVDPAIDAKPDLLLLGSEYPNKIITNPKWGNIISSIRKQYAGKISYGIRKSVLTNSINLYQPGWLDELDLIGISYYFSLTKSNSPTLNELMAGHENCAEGVENILKKFGRPIIFTEVGYRSVNGTNKHPWVWSKKMPDSDNSYDPKEQADCLDSMFRVYAKKPWWHGSFIWEAYTKQDCLHPLSGGTDYTLKDDALNIVKKWFSLQTKTAKIFI